ncbi:Lysine-specific histone demethylase 1-like protein 1 [Diplonema papillatum]|nr:Lysine-specific histone demethylase 1-like protein 1 [Diplonema papillatum]|eukprot:gene16912-25941_t
MRVLPWLGLAAAVLVAVGTWVGSRQEVAVVGAGMAGASASAELAKLGYSVRVYEARGRVGGRIHTNRDLPWPLELGAAFIHHPHRNPILNLARQNNVSTLLYDYSKGLYYDADGTKVSAESCREGFDFFEKTVFTDFFDERDALEEEEDAEWDQPMSSTLDGMGFYDRLPPPAQRLFDTFCFQYIVQDLQADLADVSSKEYDHSFLDFPRPEAPVGLAQPPPQPAARGGSTHYKQDLLVASGFDTIVKALLGATPLRLNAPVSSVTYTPEHPLFEWFDGVLTVEDWWLWTVLYDEGAAPEAACGTSGRDTLACTLGLPEWKALQSGLLDPLAASLYGALSGLAEAARHAARLAPGGAPAPLLSLGVPPGEGPGHCDKLVLTLPIGVLKNSHVAFRPPLPSSLLNAISDLGVSSTVKLGMCWQPASVFWKSETPYFHKYPADGSGKFGNGAFIEVVDLRHLTGADCLLVEAETKFADALSKLTAEDASERIMQDLRLVYPGAPSPDLGVVMSDWATSPYSAGGLVHWRVDTTTEHGAEFEYDVNRQLYWAGEHTLWQYYGNTHGAYLSGLRAAQQVHLSYLQCYGTAFTLAVLSVTSAIGGKLRLLSALATILLTALLSLMLCLSLPFS